jgi:ATP/maltotriose-dependent transcriptional regulator MalT
MGNRLTTFRDEGPLADAPTLREATPLAQPLSDRELEVLGLVATGLSNTRLQSSCS